MIVIEAGEKSPYIMIDSTNNKVVIKGNSFMANPPSFYKEISEWSTVHKVQDGSKLLVEITVGFYNTSTLKIMNILLRNLVSANPGKVDMTLFVEEEDEDLLATAQTISFNIGIEPKIVYYS